MSKLINASNKDGGGVDCSLNLLPDKCPNCQKGGQPNFVAAALLNAADPLYCVFRCPVTDCRGIYVTTYMFSGSKDGSAYGYSRQGSALNRFVEEKTFPSNIQSISPMFCKTYNQARTAEENQLDQICGPGYRKALEFLIKDYLISSVYGGDQEKQEEVRKSFLANAIEKHIDEKRIKECAKRATWLGNDEVHYTRKWEDKDIHDLKSLVLMTVNYIDMTIEADRYLKEMPA